MNTIWRYETPHNTITFEFLSDGMDEKEMFMNWVAFMNAVGYNLDKVEMENMWNSEGVAKNNIFEKEDVISLFLENLKKEGVNHANDPRFYKAEQNTLTCGVKKT